MIRVSGLTKFFGHQELFNEVDLTFHAKEKIGLIGRNGSGKSTFLKILNKQDSQSMGEIFLPNDFKIRALEQNLNFKHDELLKQVASALPEKETAELWKVESTLMGLGFTREDFSKNPKDFSSGFKIRIRLAEALVAECDLLILDEPTNYLDLPSLRWLTQFLKQWKKMLILVTHDKQFMENVVTHTVAIHRGKMRKMRGGPGKIMSQITLEERVHEKTRLNQEKKKEQTEKFIRNFRSGARSAGLVQSRIKSLAKQKIGRKLRHMPAIRLNFKTLEFKADSLMEAEEISFEFSEGNPLLKSFSLSLLKGDKIGIIGRNGKGKSTLLRLLTNRLKAQAGKIRWNPTLEIGYFGSDVIEALSPEKNLIEELTKENRLAKEQELRNICASLLFTGESVKKRVENLSGGEKSRLALGKVLMSAHHLLALDEPSNHLDMESCDILAKSLNDFGGSILFVSHNEALLSKVATKLILFEGGRAYLLKMDYQTFLEKHGWPDESSSGSSKEISSENKQRYIDEKNKKKEQRKLDNDLKKLEKEIEKLEKRKVKKGLELAEACNDKNVQLIKECGQSLKEIDDKIEAHYKELESLID